MPQTGRPMRQVLPSACDWIKAKAVTFNPDKCTVSTDNGDDVSLYCFFIKPKSYFWVLVCLSLLTGSLCYKNFVNGCLAQRSVFDNISLCICIYVF